jgi:hypothetical protein
MQTDAKVVLYVTCKYKVRLLRLCEHGVHLQLAISSVVGFFKT